MKLIYLLPLCIIGCSSADISEHKPFDYKAACGQDDCGKDSGSLAPAPWSFIDPLSIEARLKTLDEVRKLGTLYPQYEWAFLQKDLKEHPLKGWIPTPWVYKDHRAWAQLKENA